MLNTNQSHKRNLLKYALIIPALIGFVLLFQIKVIAQEKSENRIVQTIETHEGADITFDSKETDKSLKTLKNVFKEEKIVTDVSKIKRNSSGEITGVCIKMKSEDGRKKELKINQDSPIDNIFIYTNKMENGLYDFGIKHVTSDEISAIRNKIDRKRHGIYISRDNDTPMAIAMNDSVNVIGNFDFDIDLDSPEPPESPEAPEAPEAPEFPEAPEVPAWKDAQNSHIVIKRNGDKKPVVIINGKVITDDKEINEALQKYDSKGQGYCYSSTSDGDKKQIYINWDDAVKIRNKAMADAKIQMKKMRPVMKKQIKIANGNWKKVKEELERYRPEMERAKRSMEDSQPEVENAKAEMLNAKAEMEKAKAEMEAARAEYQKAKDELKSKK